VGIRTVGIVVGIVMALVTILGYIFKWRWTGMVKDDNYPRRTFWDWLDLLIVPAVLALGGVWFAAQQDARQEETDNQRAQLGALEDYLDQIGTLLLDRGLRTPDAPEEVKDLARARTLTILDMLSAERKPRALEFLYEMELIQSDPPAQENPIISLKFADLREAHLVRRHLLKGADLEQADLSKAKLYKAVLSNTNLHKANLSGAKLRKADLTGAVLTKVNLRDAKGIGCEQMEQAESLKGAIMPEEDQTYEEWRKSKGCDEDGENAGPS
jgi:pentapeptide repeat protein